MKISTFLAVITFIIASLFITFLGLILLLEINILKYTGIFLIFVGVTIFLYLISNYDRFIEVCEGVKKK